MLKVEWLCWSCEKTNKARIKTPSSDYLKEGDAFTTSGAECMHCGAESQIDIMVSSYKKG